MTEREPFKEQYESAEYLDPTPKLGPIPKHLSYESRLKETEEGTTRTKFRDGVDLHSIDVVADDALEQRGYYPRTFFLTDEEIAILNVLLESGDTPVSTAWLKSRLAGVDLDINSGRLRERLFVITRQAREENDPKNRRSSFHQTSRRKKSVPKDTDWTWAIRHDASLSDKRPERTRERSVLLDVEDVREQLRTNHYAVLADESLTFGPEFREHLLIEHFNTDIVRIHEGDVPADRERARDVVRVGNLALKGVYAADDQISPLPPGTYLARHPHTYVGERQHSNITHRPEYSRIESLNDPQLTRFIVALNDLIPPEDRPTISTMGINFFRTHTDVVAAPHQDEERYVFIYVVDKVGYGARTRLYRKDKFGIFSRTPSAAAVLEPGMLIVFKDEKFQHHTSGLIPLESGEACRDVIVCTFNYVSTHPW